jgi:hypothetical protein
VSRVRSVAPLLTGFVAALAAGWLAFPGLLYRSEPQPLRFSHAVHAGEKGGMVCEDCHQLREDGRFTGIPGVSRCAECHQSPLGDTPEEKRLVEEFVKPGREIPWKVYARQPDHVFFPHATHVRLAGLACQDCHGPHGSSDFLPRYESDRLTGYSRSIEGRSLARFARETWEGKKMVDCSHCHGAKGVRESCLDCHK